MEKLEQIEALNNALVYFNLDNLLLREYFNLDKRKKESKFYLLDKRYKKVISPVLSYDDMNLFIAGIDIGVKISL